jgi:transaldolase
MPKNIDELRVQIYADGAERDGMIALARLPYIKGLTTNPTLMRKAGIMDYVGFAKDVLSVVRDKPVSFEVFSDEFSEMERQARIIAGWGDNVYVKIPVTNTKGASSSDLVRELAGSGIKVNVTAVLTIQQVQRVVDSLRPGVPSIVPVFAGRIADTGIDPMPIMREAKKIVGRVAGAELLWASPRELFNIFQAEEAGADIVTVPHDILKKVEKIGYDLNQLSLDTVKMFYDDGQKVGYSLY